MHPKSNQKLLLFTLQAILPSIYLPGFFCSTTGQECSDVAFSCGSVRYITYPFWGGNRSESCGRKGFEIVCHGNVPMLNISSLSYRVNEINFVTNTLKVAREDIWDNTCPKVLRNTTLDSSNFKLFDSSNDQNVILYYGCTVYAKFQPPNQFSCNDGQTVNLYKAGNSSSDPGSGISCQSNIFVPVNGGAAQLLRNPTASTINILQSALAAGFSIQWPEDAKQREAPFCNGNVYRCRPCNVRNNCRRGGDTASNPAQEPQGLSPSQSPDSAPGHGTPRVINPNVKGLSPSQSPDSAPRHGTPRVRSPNVKGLSPSQSPVSTHGIQRFSSPKGKGPSLIGIIGGLLLGIICITILTIKIVCCLKRRRSQSGPKQESNHDFENFLLQQGSLAPKRYKHSEIKKITKSFSDKLGQGGYGSVYKGMLSDGSLVAVKVLIETNSNGEEFINEVASISRTSHVNIVNLLGFCFDRKKRALVYEYMPNKSLDKFISSNADWHLDLEKLYDIAVGVAKGLEYLHSGCNTRIVHFDIKPQNILLDEEFCPKISDFGLAKLCKKKQSILSMLGARGTIGYIAPEIFSRNFGGASHKSDVYSYGMMILEMAGARKIEEAEATNSSENYFPDKIYEQVVLNGTERLDDTIFEEEEEKSRKMFLVGFWCIQTTPSDRPAMSKVVEMLEGSIQSIQIPPKPTLFCPNTQSGQEVSPSLSEYVGTESFAEVIVET